MFSKSNITQRLAFGIFTGIIALGMSICYISDSKTVNVMPTYDKCIVLDSGHGGWDPGKVSSDAIEKDINLDICLKIEGYLQNGGSFVIMTRKDDAALGNKKRSDLLERKKIINAEGNDLLVSIHQNSYPNSNASGAQVFYRNDEESKKLGELIQKRLGELDNGNERKAKSNDSYYILKNSKIPAVIVECGFLSNTNDRTKLMDEDYRKKVAWCIYKGISDYFAV